MVVAAHVGFVLETHVDRFVSPRLTESAIHSIRARLSGGAMGVEFFFVLSGIVIMMAHWRDLGSPGVLRSYLWKRFRRIYPIYWLVLPVWLLLTVKASHTYDASITAPWTLLSSFLLVHMETLQQSLIVSWTLFHEVLFYAVFGIAILNKRTGSVLIAAWFLASVVALFVPGSAWLVEYLCSPLHLLFGWGMLVAWNAHERKVPQPVAWLCSGLVWFAASVWLCGVFTEWNPWVRQLAGAGAAIALVGAMQMERDGQLRIPRWMSFLGDASYSIYLVHLIALNVSLRVVMVAWQRWHPPLVVCLLPLFFAGVAFGCVVHVLVERPLLRWLSTLGSGGRRSHSHGTDGLPVVS